MTAERFASKKKKLALLLKFCGAAPCFSLGGKIELQVHATSGKLAHSCCFSSFQTFYTVDAMKTSNIWSIYVDSVVKFKKIA